MKRTCYILEIEVHKLTIWCFFTQIKLNKRKLGTKIAAVAISSAGCMCAWCLIALNFSFRPPTRKISRYRDHCVLSWAQLASNQRVWRHTLHLPSITWDVFLSYIYGQSKVSVDPTCTQNLLFISNLPNAHTHTHRIPHAHQGILCLPKMDIVAYQTPKIIPSIGPNKDWP